MAYRSGRHFLQIPGPTNVPDRILRAIDRPTIDHRGPEFRALTETLLQGLKTIFKTDDPVMIFPASGTGAWEAALVNLFSPGDRLLMFETGHFATLWRHLATRLGLDVEFVPGDWRSGASAERLETILKADREHKIKAVCAVHNETSTGVTSDLAALRACMDRLSHPALFLADTISSLASIDYRHKAWGVDVTVAGSQKGLMLPPGLSFNAVSQKALAASKHAALPRAYWRWEDMLALNAEGFFPYTPSTNLLYGLKEAITMLLEEGLEAVFARHARHGEATRRAVRAWGLELLCCDEALYSNSLTAVMMPEGQDADTLRQLILEHYDLSLGNGLGKLKGRVFRIGHLGAFNDLMLMGTLSGIEMGLARAGITHRRGGAQSALDFLAGQHAEADNKPKTESRAAS